MRTTVKRKAMEQSIWIIISIIIALATALCVIMLLANTSGDTEDNIIPIINEIGNNIMNMLTGE